MNSTRAIAVRTALTAMAFAAFAATAQSQQSDAAAIRALSNQWQRDIANQNIDRIVTLFAPDAVVMMSNSPVIRGATAIRELYAGMAKTPGLVLHWAPTKIDVASRTRATEYGTYADSWDTPQGKMRDAGSYVVIWHKINGRWRVALDAVVTSTPIPAGA
jgi:uncharacterized protein (TIGR02246 family)